ncbi:MULTISPECIES: CD225/dispanin family protein [unclassified Rhodococcus (in: high G+C Gram-positive bacteria)]|uniref:CD225/dispanin family protein n=1 Tax=unclassified Rhodococcus (in: high G+C Gram-positive bacteria) TaxID=192944 RepID=UPI000ADCA733|nr:MULTISPECIES: CD225/dispanin family protein [unclassified Rhodococcus (in: high G+C Gram-positive bacteria)]
MSDQPQNFPGQYPSYEPDLSKGPTTGQQDTGSFGAPAYPQQQPQQPQYGPPPLPPTNAGWAAAALIFFWPLAFSAFNHSSSVFPRWSLGDYQGAHYASERTKQLGKYSLYIAIGLFVLFILFYVVLIAFAVSTSSSVDYSY